MSGILRKNNLASYDSREQLLLQYHKYSSYSSILKDKDILLAILLYFILTLVQMAFDGVFPSVLANRKKFGGFGMDIADISFINMSTAPIALCPSNKLGCKLSIVLICPVWARLSKYKTQMMICCVAMVVCFFTYPLESFFNETTPIVHS